MNILVYLLLIILNRCVNMYIRIFNKMGYDRIVFFINILEYFTLLLKALK